MDQLDAALAVVVSLLATGGAYAVACWVRPFVPCPHCAGTGTRITWLRSLDVPCRWCRGGGRRLRLGRRAYNRLRRTHDRAAVAGRRLG